MSERRLTGAALNAKVTANVRDMLAKDYGLPMELYTTKMCDQYSIGSDMQPIMQLVFEHMKTGAEININDIYPGDDGQLNQFEAQLH
jgi:hypothetical protein